MDDKIITNVLGRLLDEAKISASPEYMAKEAVREQLQSLVQGAVESGSIKSQSDLKDWWDTMQMAAGALRQVPYEAWTSAKHAKKRK